MHSFPVLLSVMTVLLQAPPQRFQYAEMHMGVRARLVLYAPDAAIAERAARAAFRRVALLDSLMSDYRSDSELSRVSAVAGGAPLKISKDLFVVLSRARVFAQLSDGAFDVTAGPLVRLWRAARRRRTLPTEAARKRALARSGWRHLRLDSASHTAQLLRPGMQLDLGGIAKGYAADQALAVLAVHGVTRALVEMGGDIVASGPPPGQRGWRVAVAHAPPLMLAHGAVSTSGDTEQFVEIGSTRYSHVVNPVTGLALTDRVTATVVAADGTTADALSTLLTVLGPKRGQAFVAAHFPAVRAHIR